MNKQRALLILIAAVVLAGGVYTYRSYQEGQIQPVVEQFKWGFVDLGVNEEIHAPQTAVILTVAGVDVQLGTFTGNCFAIEGSSWELLPGELSGAICYWAGGGTEIGVFRENGQLVLKKGYVEEGGAEGGGGRGGFVPLVRDAE